MPTHQTKQNRKMKIVWLHFSCLFYTLLCLTGAKQKQTPQVLNEDTWVKLLEGEWLVKFYAPWCPACKSMEGVWEGVASWSDDLEVKLADIDVTTNPGLSGRFLVTALPTIYHVKDGIFRQYIGSRDENSIISYIDEKKWQEVLPVSWWIAPTTPHMAVLEFFFKTSMHIRTLHNSMTEEYGIPVWCSYLIFALLTIMVGLILGLTIVCCCDCLYPPQPYYRPPKQYDGLPGRKQPPGVYQQFDKDSQDIDESDVIEDDRPAARKPEPATSSSSDGAKDSVESVRKRQTVPSSD